MNALLEGAALGGWAIASWYGQALAIAVAIILLYMGITAQRKRRAQQRATQELARLHAMHTASLDPTHPRRSTR